MDLNLNQNQIAFILDAINLFDGHGDYESDNGKYRLTENEINDLISTLNPPKKSVPEIGTIWQSNSYPRTMVRIESYPFCKVTYAYEELQRKGTWRTSPNYEGEPVIKLVNYNSMPKIIVSYVMVSKPKDAHYIGKFTTYHYNGFQQTHRKISG